MIKTASEKHGFDWRFIAAMIYQESHFNPRARSYTGVRGLMQVTQRTAEEMGISNRMDPEQSIRAGVAYLASLYDRFEDVDSDKDRLLLAVASYIPGPPSLRPFLCFVCPNFTVKRVSDMRGEPSRSDM